MDEVNDLISEHLRIAREAAGLSVDDVVFQTRLPRAVIEALEEGDFSFFSCPTYAKSFLSQYSKFLKVDADAWLDALQPASFAPGETVLPLWESPTGKREVAAANHGSSSTWASALTVLAASVALLYFVSKTYAHFESRFGGDDAARTDVLVEKIPAVPPSRVVTTEEL